MEKDLCIAAFLIVKGFKLLDLITPDGQRFVFCFDDPEESADKAVLCYYGGESLPAKELFAEEKNLKALLYSKKSPKNENGNPYGNSKREGSGIG